MYIKKNSIIMFLLFLFVLSCAIFFFYFQEYITRVGINNILFVDGLTHLIASEEFLNGERNIFLQKAAWLMPVTYGVVEAIIGNIGVIIFNNFLLFKSFKYMLSSRIHIIILILFLPFYFFSSLLPNKEIIVFFLLSLYVFFLYKKNFSLLLLISLVTFLYRDGQGILLLIVTLIFIFNISLRIIAIVSFIVAFLVDKYLDFIIQLTHWFILIRTRDIIISLDKEILSYPLRVFGNITNLGSRSIITIDGTINAIGISFYLAGIGIFMAFIFSVYQLIVKSNKFDRLMSSFFLLTVNVFSISPLIQPRYIIPIAFVYLVSNNKLNKNSHLLIFLFLISFISLLILRIYYIYTIGLPKVHIFHFPYEQIFYQGIFLK